MLRHGSGMAGAQPTFSVAINQQTEDAGTLTAAEQGAAQEDDPYSRMGIFLVAGGKLVGLASPCGCRSFRCRKRLQNRKVAFPRWGETACRCPKTHHNCR